jgi:hypothetical protein
VCDRRGLAGGRDWLATVCTATAEMRVRDHVSLRPFRVAEN